MGSVKSQIGHLKAAAGIAGIMKACNAVYHNTIPPSAGFQTPNPTVEWNEIPFFVPTKARDWPEPNLTLAVQEFLHLGLEGLISTLQSKVTSPNSMPNWYLTGMEDGKHMLDMTSHLRIRRQ